VIFILPFPKVITMHTSLVVLILLSMSIMLLFTLASLGDCCVHTNEDVTTKSAIDFTTKSTIDSTTLKEDVDEMPHHHHHNHFVEPVTAGVEFVEEDEEDHHHHLERIKRSRSVTTPEKFAKLIHLVKASNLEDCAGRTVCELNCHPETFGSDGKRVLATLAKLQSSGFIQQSDMEFYVKAGVTGKKAQKSKTCKTACSKTYPACPAEVKDLVAVASLIRLSS